jgi:hypothetical protein
MDIQLFQMAGRGARWCPGFVFTYNFDMPIITNNKYVLITDNKWMPADLVRVEESLLIMTELIARYLTYGNYTVEKYFINRLINCLILYHCSIINDNRCEKVVFKNSHLLFMIDDIVQSTIDVRMFDQADIMSKYIP